MTDSSDLLIPGLSGIAHHYRGILCDVWGVVHNGVAAFKPACDALVKARESGASVILLTNAPRPSPPIYDQLSSLGVPRSAFDGVVTSGDATQAFLREQGISKVVHIGPERDLTLFDGLGIERVDPADAELVVCTGLYDDTTESPEDYTSLLKELAGLKLPFICANPDIVVERGNTMIWCAGAIARDYAKLGGDVTIFGKPYAPIYAAALAALGEAAGGDLEKSDVLAIGDGLPTDIAGAVGQGLPTLFITGGIHAADFGPVDTPDPALIEKRLADERMSVIGAMPRLVW